jgi:hypothetical protein
MSEPDFQQWIVSEPPADFATRTTRLLLHPRAPRHLPRTRLNTARLFLAAALCAAGAWGTQQATQTHFLQRPTLGDTAATPVEPGLEFAAAVAVTRALAPRQLSRKPPSEAPQPHRIVPQLNESEVPPPFPSHAPPCHCDPHGIVCSCLE